MKFPKITLPLLVCVLSACQAFASPASRQHQADLMLHKLHQGMSAADSIDVLYDVFDLSEQNRKGAYAWKILEIAERSGNNPVIIDIIPQLAVIEMRNTSKMDRLRRIASKLPEGNDKKAVLTFIDLEKMVCIGTYSSPEERRKYLYKYVKEDLTPKHDPYIDFFDLCSVVVFMGHSLQGNLYMEYLERLEHLLNDLPSNDIFPNIYYTTAANYYTMNGFPQKAVESDRKLLEIIDGLEKKYAEMGREYRTYDRFRYLCYRRMLANYSALSREEVKELFEKCRELAAESTEIQDDFYGKGFTEGYMLMGTQRYAEAVPQLQKALGFADTPNKRRLVLGMLTQAADSAGNEEALVHALKEYNGMLEARQRANAEEAIMELEMRYHVKQLQDEKRAAEEETHIMELANDQKLITLMLVAAFVLVVILMLLYRNNFRLIHKNKTLKAENEKLHRHIAELLDDGGIPGSSSLREEEGKR